MAKQNQTLIEQAYADRFPRRIDWKTVHMDRKKVGSDSKTIRMKLEKIGPDLKTIGMDEKMG